MSVRYREYNTEQTYFTIIDPEKINAFLAEVDKQETKRQTEYFDTLLLRKQMTEKLSSIQGKQRIADRSCIVGNAFQAKVARLLESLEGYRQLA